jgi:hypothetical protein
MEQLEAIANELIRTFDILTPPVPIEWMLQNPRDSMWKKVDINQLSGSFLNIREYYSPRMSMARLLARHVASSEWGKSRGLTTILMRGEDHLRAFARMLVMPSDMVSTLTAAGQNPTTMSVAFEVPEDDARIRLHELSHQRL